MEFTNWLNDDRLLANLISVHVVLAVLVIVAIILRKVLKNGGDQVARWTGIAWLSNAGKEAVKGMRAMLFWTTVVLMVVSIASMAVYHLSGRDARADFQAWSAQLSAGALMAFGIMLGKLVGLAVGVALAFRLIRRVRVFLEAYVHHHLPKHLHLETAGNVLPFGSQPPPPNHERTRLEETIRRWFTLVERFAIAFVVIGGFWLAGRFIGFTDTDHWAGLVLRITTFLVVARLLTLACSTIFHVFANLGNKHLDKGSFQRYWERVVRLFPFGERCFEAAVWVFAASRCVSALGWEGKFGDQLVQCIGIFFGTRVLIELLQVFINEMFGVHKEGREEDQKIRTLAPLLASLSQYVVYFGSVLAMLQVFEFNTTPILASAGVVGLAVGLGAQNFVTDLVSGFFILFENQYLVGDMVQIGDALGKVEAINIRTTHIRDESGKLVIIPNGQIKTVVNFSKGYANAVVDIKAPTSANLEQVMGDMAEAGKRLRDRRREVLADTIIKGLIELTPSDMVIRAVTKVQPGMHLAMQQEYRRILKEVFDESARAALKAVAA